jgi:hypothetical protein
MADERCPHCGYSHGIDEPCPIAVSPGAALDAASDQLMRWRLNQIEKLDIGTRLAALEENAKTIKSIKESMEGIRSWLMKIVGGLILALILLIINLTMAGNSGHQSQTNSHGVTQAP